MSEHLPKKRPRRDVHSRYADEERSTLSTFKPPANERVNPSRVFPNSAGFAALTKHEIRQDSIEIEKNSMLSTDSTDSEDDEETLSLSGFIPRSDRPPCAPESTIFRKKARYYHWATHPEKIASDMTQYRACVDALESRLAAQALAGDMWRECVDLARLELSSLQAALVQKSKLLENEGDKLFGILCELTGVTEPPAGAGECSLQSLSAQVPTKLRAKLTERVVEQLWADRQTVSEMLAAAASSGSTTKSQSCSPQVYLYVPPASSEVDSSQGEDDDVDTGIEDMYFLLEKVRTTARALQSGSCKSDHSPDFGDNEISAAYSKWITSLAERHLMDPNSFKKLDAAEMHARLLQAVPLSDSFCSTMLRKMSGVDRSEEIRIQEREKIARSDNKSSEVQKQAEGEKFGLVGGRAVRKRKPSSLAAEAGLEIAGIRVAAVGGVEEIDHDLDGAAMVNTEATVLRRTPRGVPLVLSDSGAMEDGFVGVFTGGEDLRVEALVQQRALPQFLLESEKNCGRGRNLRGALRRAERCLAAVESEKVEWESQLETSRIVALRAADALATVKCATDFQPPRVELAAYEEAPHVTKGDTPGSSSKSPHSARKRGGTSASSSTGQEEAGVATALQQQELTAEAAVTTSGSRNGQRKQPKRRR